MRPSRLITVVITGASSGIGRATASAFAMPGVRLVLAARGHEALDAVAHECEARGAKVLVRPTDVTDADAVRALADAAAGQGDGRIDVWVNNAGVGAIGLFDQVPITAHEQVLRVNLMGYLHGAHAVLPYFKRAGEGTLINVLSLNAWSPLPYAVAYTASKYGLRGFSEALRAELIPWSRIHVCDVMPAVVDSPAFRHSANYTGKRARPPRPLYDPRTVARAIVRTAAHPRRHRATTIGMPARIARLGNAIAPALARRFVWAMTRGYFMQASPAPTTDGNLFEPSRGMMTMDGAWRPVRERRAAGLAWAGLGLVALGATVAAMVLREGRR